MIYLELFWSMFQIGLFSVGGGYVALPLIQYQIIEKHGWLTQTEFTDIITIAEMTPGPIAINASTFVGIRVGGILGATVSTFACVLPSCIIVILLAKLYYKYRQLHAIQYVLSGLRPAVVGMIASAGLGIMLTALFVGGAADVAVDSVNLLAVGIFAAGIFALRKWRPNPFYIIGGAGALGLIAYGLLGL